MAAKCQESDPLYPEKSNGHYKNVIVLCYIFTPLSGAFCAFIANNRKK